MRKYIVEFIGAFFLVLTIGCTVIPKTQGVIAAIAIGGALMVMVYAGGHISGAHYNPAVTLAIWIRGRCDTHDVLPYMAAQLLGAIAAALIAVFVFGERTTPTILQNLPAAWVSELLFTFALAYVVLNVATAKATAGNPYYGLAIGMTVMAGAFAVGAIGGGAFNPAVAIAAAVMHVLSKSQIWIHITAEFVGAALAAVTFRFLNPTDR